MIPPEFFKGLDELCIDASSMIYLLKIGLLGSLAAEVELVSPPGVIAETDWPHLPVRAIGIDEEENGPFTNDESLVILARERNCPVLSEDYEVLMDARDSGLDYYNTLMMLNYLLLKGRIGRDEYPGYLGRLKECSHYSQMVLDEGALVHKEVLTYIEIHARSQKDI